MLFFYAKKTKNVRVFFSHPNIYCRTTFHQGSFYSCLVRVTGLEPARRRRHKNLNLTRLPISPHPLIAFLFLLAETKRESKP